MITQSEISARASTAYFPSGARLYFWKCTPGELTPGLSGDRKILTPV